MRVSGTRRGRLQAWPLRVTRVRLTSAWRLLLVVLAVSILAATAVASLGLLAVTTEQGGVHASVTALPTTDTTLEVDLVAPTASVAATTKLASGAVQKVLGADVPITSQANAFTEIDSVDALDAAGALTYFAQLDGIRPNSTLVAGRWAPAASVSANAQVPVAIPEAAAKKYGLKVGSTFVVEVAKPHGFGDHIPRTAVVAGIFRAKDPTGAYWGRDPLHGIGNTPNYPIPDSSLQQSEDAFGPLVVAPGSLDAATIQVQSLDVFVVPNLSSVTVDDLGPLINRLEDGDDTVTAHIGYVANQVDFTSNLAQPLEQIASNLVVTRSTVVVVILLLLVLAIAALIGTARLLADARAGERALMRARGASRAQILGLATLEALVIAVLTTIISPFLARLSYLVVASQPAVVAAQMPKDSGLPAIGWELAGGVGLVFAIVLIAPLLGRPTTFVEGEQRKTRQRRSSGLMRSGLDLGVVVVAAIAYWQLQTYRTPVTGSASLAIDPVLVGAPAVVLLAGALVCARLVPLVARFAERFGARSRGAVGPLATWELGRRSQRAIAAILLLTIALAVGTFGESFLATWRQSQVDQAALAVGPPVRVPATTGDADAQARALKAGAVGAAQPVIRRVAGVNGPNAGYDQSTDETQAVVLGLTGSARKMLDTGRLADEGGAAISEALVTGGARTTTTSIALPGSVAGLSGTVQVGTPKTAIAGVSASIFALLEDRDGVLSTVSLGSAPVDGLPHALSGTLPKTTTGLRFVGFQAFVDETNQATYVDTYPDTPADILVKDLAVTHPSGSTPIAPAVRARWFGDSPAGAGDRPSTGTVPAGWQLRLGVVIPAKVGQSSAIFVLMGWSPVGQIPAVVSAGLAKTIGVHRYSNFSLVLPDGSLTASVAAIAPLVPGSADYSKLTPSTASGADSKSTGAVVVDLSALERALAQSGVSGNFVDEWWVNVAPGGGQHYLDLHPAKVGGQPAVSREVLGQGMQQDPLRIETQAALWLAIFAAAILAAVGFAVHTTATMRSRGLEFAQLRAVGLARRLLVALVAAESALLGALGLIFGIAVGAALSWLTGPIVAVSPDGSPAVPSVVVIIPWLGVAVFALVIVAVLGVIVLVVANDQRRISPAGILRGGGE